MFRIYGLKCPISGSIRYIGKTKNALEGRLKGHLSDAKSFRYKHHASRWLRKLLIAGLTPEVVLLEESEGDWIEAETRWIAKGKALGWPLTNSTAGGDGAPDPTPDALDRKRRVMRQVWERPEFIQRMREARNDPTFVVEQGDRLKGRWLDRDAREKMMATRWTDGQRDSQREALAARKSKIQASLTPEVIARRNASIKASWAKRKASKA